MRLMHVALYADFEESVDTSVLLNQATGLVEPTAKSLAFFLLIANRLLDNSL